MKNYSEKLNQIETLKREGKSKIKIVKLMMLKDEINKLEESLNYKKGRVYPGIDENESLEHDNLFEFFGGENLDDIEKGIKLLKKVLTEASK